MSAVAESVFPLLVSLASGALLLVLVKWRPEATSSAVQASEEAVAIVRGELHHLKDEVDELRAQLVELRNALRTAERDATEWRHRYETERSDHVLTKQELAGVQARLAMKNRPTEGKG